MKDLTEGNVFKQILYFSIPMLFGNVFQQLYNVVDSIIVGNYLGNEALAAVGASFPVIFVLISMILGITLGMSIVISQYYGAKDLRNVKRAIDSMMIFIIISGIVVGIIGYIFANSIFRLLGFPEEVIIQAGTYFKIFIAGIIFMFGYNGVSAILRGLGDSKTPLYFLILSTVLNIFLDLVFIVVFENGIEGVAFATIISQAVSFIGMSIWLNVKHKFIKIKFINLEFARDIFLKSLRIGLPSGIQQTIVGLSITALISIVSDFGTATIAGFTVATRLDSFAMMPAMNISIAITSFVGQNIGAGKVSRVAKGYHTALSLSGVISIIIGLIFIFFGKHLTGFFSPDIAVQEVGDAYLSTIGGFYIAFSGMLITQGVLRGAGDTIFPMIFTIISLIFIRVPLAWFLSREWFDLGSDGIWWGTPIAWSVGFILSFIYYRSGKWKNKSIVKTNLS
ncbi:MAG: MATE family efflux transporter [Candidatus Cloacimonetes bacterium]|jgi:putative MATE family efflux protein|nr:MATE family efflux transporter [Candidatus Cloacimonadota bacterium]MDD4155556.1 MATE family efflux transporter [Candidatus Cloacimonadota bacterium]